MDTLRWNDGVLYLLDQRRLPFEEIYLTCTTWRDVEYAISVLAVRGAPAIGVAAAYAVVLASESLVSIRNRNSMMTRWAVLRSCWIKAGRQR